MELATDKKVICGRYSNLCPSCHSNLIVEVGTIPRAMHFCSNSYRHPVNASRLFECANCKLYFRNPCLGGNLIQKLYEVQPSDLWVDNAAISERIDFQLIVNFLSDWTNASEVEVLDVGCYNGMLLQSIKNQLPSAHLYGIEPSIHAAAEAEVKEIKIIGNSYIALRDNHHEYDIITAVDVFEHVYDSKGFMQQLLSRLKLGGLLIIATGDASRFETPINQYYYVSMPEHLVFLSRSHAEWIQNHYDLEIISYSCFSHGSISRSGIFLALRVILFRLLQYLPDKWFSRRPLSRLSRLRGAGLGGGKGSDDHCLVVFKKRGNQDAAHFNLSKAP